MEEVGSDGASPVSPLSKWRNEFSRAFQYYLDRSAPHLVNRWLGTLVAAAIYIFRVYYVQGFYVISYGLGIYILNLLIGFMSPKVDPELEVLDGPSLPTKDSDEFRPFIRRLPEFKFWCDKYCFCMLSISSCYMFKRWILCLSLWQQAVTYLMLHIICNIFLRF